MDRFQGVGPSSIKGILNCQIAGILIRTSTVHLFVSFWGISQDLSPYVSRRRSPRPSLEFRCCPQAHSRTGSPLAVATATRLLTQSAAGTKCRACLEGDRVKCISCGSDIYGLYDQCLYRHRSKVFTTMKAELRKRGEKEGGFSKQCLQYAWRRELEAKSTDDPQEKEALIFLAGQARHWAVEDDEPLAGLEPVPLVDRDGVERGS